MTQTRFYAILLLCTLFISAGVSAQNIVLKQSNESGIYHSGEPIRLKIFLTNRNADSVSVSTRRNYSPLAAKQTYAYKGDSLLIFSETASTTGSIIFDVTTKTDTAAVGLLVDPEKLTVSTTRP